MGILGYIKNHFLVTNIKILENRWIYGDMCDTPYMDKGTLSYKKIDFIIYSCRGQLNEENDYFLKTKVYQNFIHLIHLIRLFHVTH